MAADFMPEPLRRLETDAELLAALENPDWYRGRDSFRIRAEPIIEVIKQIEDEGLYPYNDDIMRRVEARLGIPQQAPTGVEAIPLGHLVYNAQRYRGTDRLIERGFEPLTPEMLARVGVGGKIEIHGYSMLGNPTTEVRNVREIGGKLYAMKPRVRKYATEFGVPARVVQFGKQTAV